MAKNDGFAIFGVGEEGAIAKSEWLNLDKIRVGAEDGDGIEGVLLRFDSVGRNGNRSSSGNTSNALDSTDIARGEAGLLEGVSGGELFDNISNSILRAAGANNDEVGADFFSLILDEVGDATHER